MEVQNAYDLKAEMEAIENQMKDIDKQLKRKWADQGVEPQTDLERTKVEDLEKVLEQQKEKEKENIIDDVLLTVRDDSFINFLKLAIGSVGDFRLSDCFICMPPLYATKYEEYKSFLKPYILSSLVQVMFRLNQLLSGRGQMDTQQFIDTCPHSVLLAGAILMGILMTKSHVLNTLQSLPTKTTTLEMKNREINALVQFRDAVRKELRLS